VAQYRLVPGSNRVVGSAEFDLVDLVTGKHVAVTADAHRTGAGQVEAVVGAGDVDGCNGGVDHGDVATLYPDAARGIDRQRAAGSGDDDIPALALQQG